MKRIFVLLTLVSELSVKAQFAPSVGQPGTTAIYKDSSVFVAWATACSVQRGHQDMSNTSLGYANVGDSSMATGVPGPGIVSLGDNGQATLFFNSGITDGPGFDFAVFENSFSDDFLELAFVEVSNDGVNFFRFPATSNTQDTFQTNSFGPTDATRINNLAGKYRGGYGTPFDLNDLAGTAGLDINAVSAVRIVDVVGSINPLYATYDSQGHKVNDPWPTGFGSSGFDLDAVGVIHTVPLGIKTENEISFTVFPNPAQTHITVQLSNTAYSTIGIKNVLGQTVYHNLDPQQKTIIDINDLQKGLYFVEVISGSKKSIQKILVQ